MTRYLTSLILTVSILLTSPAVAQTETDTVALKNFILKQQPEEKKFVDLLKKGRTDSCLKYFSSVVVKKYGTDSLKKEIKHLTSLFKKYPSPEVMYSIGENFNGVGTSGHDSEGQFELKCLYRFMDKQRVVYYFSLYYSDREPVGKIKFYESENFEDPVYKNMKPMPIPGLKDN